MRRAPDVGATGPEAEAFVLAYGEALSRGDGDAVARMWELPALVLADGGAVAVGSAEQVAEFFAGQPAVYAESGIHATRAVSVAVEQLSDELCSADVRWVGLDAEGNRTDHTELSTYVLRRDAGGTLRIQVAITRTSRIPD